jgi:hypothetical protein
MEAPEEKEENYQVQQPCLIKEPSAFEIAKQHISIHTQQKEAIMPMKLHSISQASRGCFSSHLDNCRQPTVPHDYIGRVDQIIDLVTEKQRETGLKIRERFARFEMMVTA